MCPSGHTPRCVTRMPPRVLRCLAVTVSDRGVAGGLASTGADGGTRARGRGRWELRGVHRMTGAMLSWGSQQRLSLHSEKGRVSCSLRVLWTRRRWERRKESRGFRPQQPGWSCRSRSWKTAGPPWEARGPAVSVAPPRRPPDISVETFRPRQARSSRAETGPCCAHP